MFKPTQIIPENPTWYQFPFLDLNWMPGTEIYVSDIDEINNLLKRDG